MTKMSADPALVSEMPLPNDAVPSKRPVTRAGAITGLLRMFRLTMGERMEERSSGGLFLPAEVIITNTVGYRLLQRTRAQFEVCEEEKQLLHSKR